MAKVKGMLLQINHLGSSSKETSGIQLIIFHLFSFTLIHSEIAGSHLSFGFGLIPVEISMQFSFWEGRYGQYK
jgi:hypothetical protein|tara:strand:+ start:2477 stop:2695 length:219 start_codon:yes stop_codon:yes gene_type:complete